jgi:hypothetical protein
VLGRGHCSRIDVHVRVNLDSRDLETGRLEQETRARGDNALADTAAASVSRQTHLAVELFPLSTRLPCQKEGHLRDDTSSNENVFDHGEELRPPVSPKHAAANARSQRVSPRYKEETRVWGGKAQVQRQRFVKWVWTWVEAGEGSGVPR